LKNRAIAVAHGYYDKIECFVFADAAAEPKKRTMNDTPLSPGYSFRP